MKNMTNSTLGYICKSVMLDFLPNLQCMEHDIPLHCCFYLYISNLVRVVGFHLLCSQQKILDLIKL